MKLFFKKIRIKNFLSIGAMPVEFDYVSGIHAIIAKINNGTTNGQGKSTLFDALVYALYGVSMRGLTKKQLPNNINGAECEVTLWLDINDVAYRIERGLNPDYFRLINETDVTDDKERSSKKQDQTKLEDLIGISYTSFINSITLNINYSSPFFKLEAAKKRQVLEDILNLGVYGKMFEKVKKEVNGFKTEKRVLESEVSNNKELYNSKKQTLDRLELKRKEFETEKNNKIEGLLKNSEINKQKLQDFKSKLPDRDFESIRKTLVAAKDAVSAKMTRLSSEVSSSERSLIPATKELKYILANPICPVCKTPTTSSDHTKTHILGIENSITQYNKEIEEGKEQLTRLEPKSQEIREKLQKVEDAINKVASLKIIIERLETAVEMEQKAIQVETNRVFEVGTVITESDVETAKSKLTLKEEEYVETDKKLKYSEFAKQILGDDGIKKYIIKSVIPMLNKKCNEYLSLFNAPYTLSFNADLQEVFKTRNRAERVYASFSAGEQKRIDLAFMFALLDIAKAQCSITSNLLILDEIIDSSLCANGILQLMSFLKMEFRKANPTACVYVVSHKAEVVEDHFNSIITVRKDAEFTKIDSIRLVEQVLQV